MILISHRGNTTGPDLDNENKTSRVDEVLEMGFDVEIDVRVVDGGIFLGHDFCSERVSQEWMTERYDKLWIHCKNLEALDFFSETKANYFWHDKDEYTLTSKGFVWAYPGCDTSKNTVIVLPELADRSKLKFENCVGICSDFISNIGKIK